MGPALSPSRAADFMQCPLLYRFRVVDRFPETPSTAAARGTLVHAVLERIFELPAHGRTLEAARELLVPGWAAVLEERPELATLFGDTDTDTDSDVDTDADADTDAGSEPGAGSEPKAGSGNTDRPPSAGVAGGAEEFAAWISSAEDLLARWFELEDPTRLEPAQREYAVETEIEGGLRLRGIVDRLDVAPDGRMRVVDYKTGRVPSVAFEAKALFQMKFYALVLWRMTGRLPTLLQLVYLGSGDVLRYAPDEADLLGTERKVRALWAAILRAARAGDWRPSPGRLCDWCDHHERCPAQGGTLPALPEDAVRRVCGDSERPLDADLIGA